METVAKKYKDRAEFIFLYCREAHPEGDKRVKTRTKKNEPIKQHETIEQRKQIAEQFCQDMKLTRRILVDDFESGSVQKLYGGRPNPTVVIDKDGTIALKMAWTNGQDLDRFLSAFLAQGGRVDLKLAATVPQKGGGGPGAGPDMARMIEKMLEGIDLSETEARAAKEILQAKMQSRGRLRQEALALEKLAHGRDAGNEEITRATRHFEDQVAKFQKQAAEWDEKLARQVSARARAQLLAAGLLENGLGFMARPGFGPQPGLPPKKERSDR